MSRSGYSDSLDEWELIRWRGAVTSAMRGKRGQAFLRDMRDALDALPEHRLVESELVAPDGECCAMGAVCLARELDVDGVDPYDRDRVAEVLGIAGAMAAEIAFMNDEAAYRRETPEERWKRMRAWVESLIATPSQEEDHGTR
jgi:hypothetical protein